ncbi:tumor necrosis factor, alpha-induced protein 8-like protein 2 A [Salminus brasiliensis]|uniref:tumor necrosis factor, alpha-induced protein 8-like protein 2 A n=1 Tax=Salminus brasiliensis TaxID=930266 RepID=UPI003B831B70
MEAFSSKDLAMKAQKKILSRMASKSMAQMLVDDTSGEVLDELYRVSKLHSGNRAEAQKVSKDLVKVAVKVAILIKHNKFSQDELNLAQEFRKKLHTGAMTAISFQEVEYSFDKEVMIDHLSGCRDLLVKLVENHLTPKSVGRIQHVFNHYSDPKLLTHLYDQQGVLWPSLTKICSGLNRLIEEDKL